MVADRVDLGDQGVVLREHVKHMGAVAVVAMNDDGEIALILQYRHPAKAKLWEIPAGLLDVPGEPLLVAAQRELAEEVDLTASQWHVLVDLLTSPGGTDETLRIYLARGLVPTDTPHVREAEEADMELRWVPLAEVVEAVMAGRVRDMAVVAGVLAVQAAQAAGWATLRPADAPTPPGVGGNR